MIITEVDRLGRNKKFFAGNELTSRIMTIHNDVKDIVYEALISDNLFLAVLVCLGVVT